MNTMTEIDEITKLRKELEDAKTRIWELEMKQCAILREHKELWLSGDLEAARERIDVMKEELDEHREEYLQDREAYSQLWQIAVDGGLKEEMRKVGLYVDKAC